MNLHRTKPLTLIATASVVAAVVHVGIFSFARPTRSAIADDIAQERAKMATDQSGVASMQDQSHEASDLRAALQVIATKLPDDAGVDALVTSLPKLAADHSMQVDAVSKLPGQAYGAWAGRIVRLQLSGAAENLASTVAAIESLPERPRVRTCSLTVDGEGQSRLNLEVSILCRTGDAAK